MEILGRSLVAKQNFCLCYFTLFSVALTCVGIEIMGRSLVAKMTRGTSKTVTDPTPASIVFGARDASDLSYVNVICSLSGAPLTWVLRLGYL